MPEYWPSPEEHARQIRVVRIVRPIAVVLIAAFVVVLVYVLGVAVLDMIGFTAHYDAITDH